MKSSLPKRKIVPPATSHARCAISNYLSHRRKLNVEYPIFWSHHRGGWRDVVRLIQTELHCEDGVTFVSAIEDVIHEGKIITEPWVGFIHQVPRQRLGFPDLERLLLHYAWKESAKHCLGLFVLTDYQKRFLKECGVTIPIARLYYPVEPTEKLFSFSTFVRKRKKKLLFIGEFLRNYQAFYDLSAEGFEKILLQHEGFNPARLHLRGDHVTLSDRVSEQQYDRLLQDSIVFLNLYDVVANTTILECIVRNTPVLVNKIGAATEYLGESYPLLYDTLQQAADMLHDDELIKRATDYLAELPLKRRLTADYFLDSLENTAIYRSLPTPRSQEVHFKTYDVSVLICSYKRVAGIEHLLNCMQRQDFGGTFEVILWNNNGEAATQLDKICRRFKTGLNLKVIHSSENFYCISRLALASLVSSDLMLICDDDVIPAPAYISTFMEKYNEHGPEAVLCCRGHRFAPHTLDEDDPDLVWRENKHVEFYDERREDREIHFMHADNCLIPVHILKQLLTYKMEHREFILVDDYWMSYVISHQLRIPIWKIRADGLIKFAKSAEDPNLALFYNDRVREQRVNFYVYHMRHGWPWPNENRDSVTSQKKFQRHAFRDDWPFDDSLWDEAHSLRHPLRSDKR